MALAFSTYCELRLWHIPQVRSCSARGLMFDVAGANQQALDAVGRFVFHCNIHGYEAFVTLQQVAAYKRYRAFELACNATVTHGLVYLIEHLLELSAIDLLIELRREILGIWHGRLALQCGKNGLEVLLQGFFCGGVWRRQAGGCCCGRCVCSSGCWGILRQGRSGKRKS